MNWVLLCFIGFYLVLLGCYWVLMGLTELYWVLLGFVEFYWVLLGFTLIDPTQPTKGFSVFFC